MKIHELSQRTGLTAPTIRFYEKEGLLDSRHVRRGDNNYRDYSERTVEHLLILKKIQAAGFTLTELKEVVQADRTHELSDQKKVELLRQKMREVESKKAELEQIQTYLGQMLTHRMAVEGNT